MLLERQLDLVQILAGLNQHQWAFVNDLNRLALTWHVNRLGFIGDDFLNHADLFSIRVDPFQTSGLSDAVQILQGQHERLDRLCNRCGSWSRCGLSCHRCRRWGCYRCCSLSHRGRGLRRQAERTCIVGRRCQRQGQLNGRIVARLSCRGLIAAFSLLGALASFTTIAIAVTVAAATVFVITTFCLGCVTGSFWRGGVCAAFSAFDHIHTFFTLTAATTTATAATATFAVTVRAIGSRTGLTFWCDGAGQA